jgi:hypothetical protein
MVAAVAGQELKVLGLMEQVVQALPPTDIMRALVAVDRAGLVLLVLPGVHMGAVREAGLLGGFFPLKETPKGPLEPLHLQVFMAQPAQFVLCGAVVDPILLTQRTCNQ